MKPTFTYALRYFVTVTCVSPLRTGNSDRDQQEVLRYWDCTPFLQGTSLAGAMKAWKPNEALLGSETRESALIVSDLVFASTNLASRPRLRVDGATGTAAQGGKFDVSAIAAGTSGSFQLTWRGTRGLDDAANAIEEYLTAIHTGQITLGAQKSNGYGRVTLQVRKRSYDLSNPADRAAWLSGDEISDATPVALLNIPDSDTVFRVTAEVSSLLVKSSTTKQKSQGSYAAQMQENGRYIVPGSSIKGVLRSQISQIAPYFPAEAEVVCLLGRMNEGTDNGIAGKARFSDGILSNSRQTVTTRVRIDRFTGGTMHRGLFSEESVDGTLKFEIRVPDGYDVGCGLIAFALRDLGLGLFSLGSGSSIGRGRLETMEVRIQRKDQLAVMRCAGGRVTIDDPQNLTGAWRGLLNGRADQ